MGRAGPTGCTGVGPRYQGGRKPIARGGLPPHCRIGLDPNTRVPATGVDTVPSPRRNPLRFFVLSNIKAQLSPRCRVNPQAPTYEQ